MWPDLEEQVAVEQAQITQLFLLYRATIYKSSQQEPDFRNLTNSLYKHDMACTLNAGRLRCQLGDVLKLNVLFVKFERFAAQVEHEHAEGTG